MSTRTHRMPPENSTAVNGVSTDHQRPCDDSRMPLPARQLLTKALHLLDRGETERGESVLRDTVASAVKAGDSTTTVAALCCLGELLAQQGRRREAVETLRSCLGVPVSDDHGDLCAAERTNARQLLADLA
ncbi:hypothetical protein AB0D32_13580 [Micromonospora sp. NPDC048170]|uniref:hypothetical protein n=1 Tax=Micromonospora sp. NPDC048170 TaxID=3154819 RepID=UPI0033E76C50